MVLRGRSLYISDFPSSRRAASVPIGSAYLHRVEDLNDDYEPDSGTVAFSRASRAFQEADDLLAASKIYDRDYLRDTRVVAPAYFSSVHPPAPIVLDPSPLVYGSSIATAPYTYAHHTPRHHAPLHYNYHSYSHSGAPQSRAFSTDSKHRTWGARPVQRRRTAMDEEVDEFLASTPQSRYPGYTSNFRSRSTPAVSHYSSYSVPSYTTQHLYRPLGQTGNWTSHDNFESGHASHYPSYSRSTHSIYHSSSPAAAHTPFVSSVYKPLANYTPSSVVRASSVMGRPISMAGSHYKPASHGTHMEISTDLTYSARPSVSSVNKLHGDDSYSSRPARSRMSTQDLHSTARKPRSASADAPHPIVNYKDIKPPISDTRRKVRDLICKTRKDPRYYE